MNDDTRDLSLLEAIDHLLDRGAVIAGEATISLADVDLLYLGLNVVLANVDSLRRLDEQRDASTAERNDEAAPSE